MTDAIAAASNHTQRTRPMLQRLREDIRIVFDRDPAARTAFEVLTTYPGLHAVLYYRLSHRLWKMGCKWLARFVSTFVRWLTASRFILPLRSAAVSSSITAWAW